MSVTSSLKWLSPMAGSLSIHALMAPMSFSVEPSAMLETMSLTMFFDWTPPLSFWPVRSSLVPISAPMTLVRSVEVWLMVSG